MSNPFQVAIRMAMKLHYWSWSAWRGYGRPHSRETWDAQYRAGEWDYLNSLDEVDRYLIIVGYIRHFFDQVEILDVGCGHGRLLRLLPPSFVTRYTGVDISEEAIAQAARLKTIGAQFVTEDFEKWTPLDLVDIIVFNESLYYGGNPMAIVQRYLPALKAGGKIIVSMQEGGTNDIIWRKLDLALRRVHGVHLRNDRGQGWIVRMFDPHSDSSVTK